MNISGISPAKGSPYGGQQITISGSSFGASGTVTIDGRLAGIVSWSATSIVATVPERSTAGVMDFSGGSVACVVSDGVNSASSSYEYAATIWERALVSIMARIASQSLQAGAFFNYSAQQVTTSKIDQTADTGAEWPQVIVYPVLDSFSQETFEQGFYVSDFDFVVQAVFPLGSGGMPQWYNQCCHVASDMFRAIMSDIGNSGTTNTIQIKSWEPGVVADPNAGALAVVSIECTMNLRVILEDPTSQTVTPLY